MNLWILGLPTGGYRISRASGSLVCRQRIEAQFTSATGWYIPWSISVYRHTIQYIALHCITLHCIPLHSITLHYSTLLYSTLLYSTLHYITYSWLMTHDVVSLSCLVIVSPGICWLNPRFSTAGKWSYVQRNSAGKRCARIVWRETIKTCEEPPRPKVSVNEDHLNQDYWDTKYERFELVHRPTKIHRPSDLFTSLEASRAVPKSWIAWLRLKSRWMLLFWWLVGKWFCKTKSRIHRRRMIGFNGLQHREQVQNKICMLHASSG